MVRATSPAQAMLMAVRVSATGTPVRRRRNQSRTAVAAPRSSWRGRPAPSRSRMAAIAAAVMSRRAAKDRVMKGMAGFRGGPLPASIREGVSSVTVDREPRKDKDEA
jgi:hypothetical protein